MITYELRGRAGKKKDMIHYINKFYLRLTNIYSYIFINKKKRLIPFFLLKKII
jgi:hypothetical protein